MLMMDRLLTYKNQYRFFMTVVVLHFFEHVVQAYQFFVLGWPRKESLGLLGVWHPWLIHSEWLHYSLAIFMLVGLVHLRSGIPEGKPRQWWDVAIVLQFFHHIEHLVPLVQALTGRYIYGASKPMSIMEYFIPRLELHFIYNCIVMTPIVMSMLLMMKKGKQDGSSNNGLRHEA